MFCKYCGNEINEYNKFCPKCGGALKDTVSNHSNKKEGLAKASKVLGILSLIALVVMNWASLILSILAIVFACCCSKENDPKVRSNRNVGLITGIIAIVLEVLFIVLFIVFSAEIYSELLEYLGEILENPEYYYNPEDYESMVIIGALI